MAGSYRLPEGGRVDRSKPLNFTFDGKTYEGLAGDTFASALLANGVHLVGRSFKYHRPRGILSAGAEEPNALLQVGRDPRTDPNTRATQAELFDGAVLASQNRWPGLRFDVSAMNGLFSRIIPAGFYYKTFMWPSALWMQYESLIRKAAGLGRAPRRPDPDTYDKLYAHCDVLVVGAGPAGLAAALAATRAGARVILADEQPEVGGSLLSSRETINGRAAMDWVDGILGELRAAKETRLLTRATVYGYFDHNLLGVFERVSDHLPDSKRGADQPRHRLWKVRAKQVVLATGSLERPLVFADNDRPGIMLASAVQSYINRYAVLPGRRGVLVTNNDGGYAAALDMLEAGINLAGVVDLRHDPEGPLTERAEAAGIKILAGQSVTATEGRHRLSRIRVAPMDEAGETATGTGRTIDCDFLAMAGGWNPTAHLFSQSRGTLRFDEARGCFLPDRPAQATHSAGACNGAFSTAAAIAEGFEAGSEAAAAAGLETTPPPLHAEAEEQDFLPARCLWVLPGEKPLGQGGKHFVDFQNDVTAADLQLALREGYHSIEHVKRYTTTGMGTDQGKTSNVNALGIVAATQGVEVGELGVTTFRPPYTPISFGALAGRDYGELLDPTRRTPMHDWHLRAGATFEAVGQWLRPWYYPQGEEDMPAAVARECAAVRQSVGILDATTLGRIEIQGPDAVTLLNRVYTNGWSTLKVGRCRYGLMLGEDGMVMDDGVTARLGENRYLMHTTSGNAAAVFAHLEHWLQTEWPDLKVYLTSVTEQYATCSIAGPNARRLLGELTRDIDLSSEAFPFMAWREGHVAGIPARVFRISFTGDLSYEINVPADYGLVLWQALMTAGAKYGITPYGTETMHVLRAEKGFIIVGQETDGSVTPQDLGMGGLCSTKKDFIGKRSLSRPDMLDPNRKQLVGLETLDPMTVLEEGAQLVEDPQAHKPMPMVGHVTSSYWSPALGRSIALALVKGGHSKHGKLVYAPMAEGTTIACTIRDTVFFDKEGARLHA